MMEIFKIIAGIIAAYLIGSIPSAVWVGKAFYGVDRCKKLVGVGIALYPYEVYIVIAIFVVMLLLFKYVSLASITASVAFPFIVIFGFHQRSTALMLLAIFVGVFIPITHRKNIKRLLNGTESKFSTKKKNPG